MPRPKVLKERRLRIAKACLYCQASKQKCDGLAPCVQCTKRGKSNACVYSAHQRSYGRRPRDVGVGQGSASPSEQALLPSSDMILPESNGMNEPVGSIAVPKLPHDMFDTKGRRVLYLGRCAALSFLQNIQELIEGETELAEVAADVGCFPVYEELPPTREENIMAYSTTNTEDIKELVDVFFASTGGILDIFGRAYLEDLVSGWADGSLDMNSGSAAIMYLAIAYAAQARCSTAMDVHRAQSFYNRGRQIALLELTHDPTLETVQAFILISLYMLGCSRRNGAYLNIGIAISAAKSIGCHRDETNAQFPESDGRLRKRIWRTLRYHDLFFCAMMGRTSAIVTTDSTVLDEQLSMLNSDSPDFCHELGLLESARAFSFMERTVNEVYTKQTVPLGLLQRISQELQEASSQVPDDLRTVPTPNSPSGSPRRARQYILRNASVACNYYFSMMLLTRPFLVTSLRAKYSRAATTASKINARANPPEAKIYTEIMHGAITSIDSAIKTIQLLHELMIGGILFNNMPLVVAWAFVAALTVCSAYFGRLGVLRDCKLAIQQAEEVVQHFARNSPQAKRYVLILEKLSRAALEYVKRLEHKEQVAQITLLPELFRLNPAQYTYANDNSRAPITFHQSVRQHTARAPLSRGNHSHDSQRQGGRGEPQVTSNKSFETRASNGKSNQPNAPTSGSNFSFNLEHTFHDLGIPPLDMGSDPVGDYIVDFENTESLWDLDWGGAML